MSLDVSYVGSSITIEFVMVILLVIYDNAEIFN